MADAFNRAALVTRLTTVLPLARTLLLALGLILQAGCGVRLGGPGIPAEPPGESAPAFLMPDGTRLPYHAWLPEGQPWAVVLALHGMNDSRDAWEYPAADFTAAGIAVFSPDQRGFGATSTRGYWAGGQEMASDARAMVRQLRTQYPKARLILMGESMGAAVLMLLATEPDPPHVDGYVLIAPAVWARSEMNLLLRASLWVATNTVPGVRLTGGGLIKVTASDNREALRRLSMDPLTIHATRIDAINGLVNLMDAASAAAPRFQAPALFMYGGHDDLIPPEATTAVWRALPAGPVRAFYPAGYHLLLRDLRRVTPTEDIIAWIMRPHTPLPSGADRAGAAWLAKQP